MTERSSIGQIKSIDMPTNFIKYPDAYNAIIDLMEHNGFKKQKDGSIVKDSTGCYFSFNSLNNYDSLMSFQIDWPYSKDD